MVYAENQIPSQIDSNRLASDSQTAAGRQQQAYSGKKVWEYEAASPVTSSPAVAKGKVVVATADGQVICFG
jgi:outer membrane protein assembly factor BamB